MFSNNKNLNRAIRKPKNSTIKPSVRHDRGPVLIKIIRPTT